MRTTIIGGPGKREPFFVFGGTARHVVLRGRLGSLIWNPPYEWLGKEWKTDLLDHIKAFYSTVDWAIDVSEARFQSVPAFRFGPPGDLIRRDPATQALVKRARALTFDWKALGRRIGVWRVVLEDLVTFPWPESIVLIPAILGSRHREEIEGIELLRSVGLAE